ncbi:ABC transporter permease [bacterium]|nr:ABC transporter permease [bacterium]
MFKNYLKIAFRNLQRHKGYSFINIAGLAIGMACCLLILLYIQNELSYDKYHQKADQIYRFVIDYETKGQVFPNALSSAPMAPQLLTDYPDILEVVRFYPRSQDVLVRHNEKSFYESRFFYADASVFDIFTFPLIKGDPQTALIDPFAVVITQEMAKKHFAEQDPIGKVLQVENKESYKITGVMKSVPQNSHFSFDFLASFETLPALQNDLPLGLDSWTSNPFYTYVLLPKGHPVAQLEAKFPAFAEKYVGETLKRVGWKWRPWLQPLTRIHLYPLSNEIQSGSNINYIYIFSAIAVFILLIACINFMNLATARSANRAKEVGLRKVVGANRLQLVKQFLGESIVISLISFLIAVVLVQVLLPMFNDLVGKELETDYTQNLAYLAGFIGMALFVGVVSGSYPAFFLSAFQPAKVLKGTVKAGGKSLTMRKILVVSQFAISIALIISTVVVLSQLNYMRTKSLGLNQEQIVVVPIRDQRILNSYQSLKTSLLQGPNVVSATLTNYPPGRGTFGRAVHLEGESPDQLKSMKFLLVDHDYVETLEIELVAGRDFSLERSTDATQGFLINEQAVKEFGWQDPQEAIGRRIVWARGQVGTVIGVVKDFHFQPLRIFMQPLILNIAPVGFNFLLVRIAPQNIAQSLEFVRQTWNDFAPDWPFVYSFLDEDFHNLYQVEERFGKVFGNFATIAIIIACLGLLGLASFSAEQRTKEIGVRKILGASAGKIVLLLSQEFTKLVLLSNLLSWPVAYYFMSKWLQAFSFRIDLNVYLWTFVLAGALALLIAWLTVGYQAARASLTNPVNALRYE